MSGINRVDRCNAESRNESTEMHGDGSVEVAVGVAVATGAVGVATCQC
jgi:hypothetical protein